MMKKAVIFFLLSIGQGFNSKAQNSLAQWDAYINSTFIERYIVYREFKASRELYSIIYFDYKGDQYLVESNHCTVSKVIGAVDLNLFDYLIENKSYFKKMFKDPSTPKIVKTKLIKGYKHQIDTSVIQKSLIIRHKKFNKLTFYTLLSKECREKYDMQYEILDEIATKIQAALKGEQKAVVTKIKD